MRKLKLDVGVLRVESFPTSSSTGEKVGTVRGYHTTGPVPITAPATYSEDLRCDGGGGGGSTDCPITTFDIPCITFTCL